jgi:hypothetical protein
LDVIDVQRDHGKDVSTAEGVDARIRHALFPPLFDQPVPRESVELTGELFEAAHATLEVAHLEGSICEAMGLPDVGILFDRSMEEG